MIQLNSIVHQGDTWLLTYRSDHGEATVNFQSEEKAKLYFSKVILKRVCELLVKYAKLQKNEISQFYFNENRILNKRFDQYRDQYYKLLKAAEEAPVILTMEPCRAYSQLCDALFSVISTVPPRVKNKKFNWSKAYNECYKMAREMDQSLTVIKQYCK